MDKANQIYLFTFLIHDITNSGNSKVSIPNPKKEPGRIEEAYKYIAQNNYFSDIKYLVVDTFSLFSYIPFFCFPLRKRGKKCKTSDMNSKTMNK